MNNTLKTLNGLVVPKNTKGDKVEQKASRAIKTDLMDAFAKFAQQSDIEVMYDEKGLPVLSFDNGLIIGFDFIVRKLDTAISSQKPTAK